MRKWKISYVSDFSGHRVRTTKAFSTKAQAESYKKKQLNVKQKAKVISVGSRTKSKSLLR